MIIVTNVVSLASSHSSVYMHSFISLHFISMASTEPMKNTHTVNILQNNKIDVFTNLSQIFRPKAENQLRCSLGSCNRGRCTVTEGMVCSASKK